MPRLSAWLIVCAGTLCSPAAAAPAVTKTGDVLAFTGKQLAMDNSKVVQDAGAPGGQAVQSKGKAWYVVHKRTRDIPAGRYRVTVRVQVRKRTTGQHVGRLMVNTERLD